MKTKIIFYLTTYEQGHFSKCVFECIVDEIFDESWEVEDYIDSQLSNIINEFILDVIFDRIIIDYKEIKSNNIGIRLLRTEKGTLQFETNELTKDTIVKTIKSDKTDIKDIEREYKILREKVEKKLLVLDKKEIELLQFENELLRKDLKLRQEELDKSKIVKKDNMSCWIDLSGTVYEVGLAEHNSFASDYLEELIGNEALIDYHGYPYELLQEKGWIRILGWTDPVSFVFANKITPKQKQAVRDYCANERIGLPEELKS